MAVDAGRHRALLQGKLPVAVCGDGSSHGGTRRCPVWVPKALHWSAIRLAHTSSAERKEAA